MPEPLHLYYLIASHLRHQRFFQKNSDSDISRIEITTRESHSRFQCLQHANYNHNTVTNHYSVIEISLAFMRVKSSCTFPPNYNLLRVCSGHVLGSQHLYNELEVAHNAITSHSHIQTQLLSYSLIRNDLQFRRTSDVTNLYMDRRLSGHYNSHILIVSDKITDHKRSLRYIKMQLIPFDVVRVFGRKCGRTPH